MPHNARLPDPALLNAPLTALTALNGAGGMLADALPVPGLHLSVDPQAQTQISWSSPAGRLIDLTSTVTKPGRWCALRLTLDLPDLGGIAGLGLWLRSAADTALVTRACLRSGTDDGHVDCYFEREILSHAATSDHHAVMMMDRTPDLPIKAPWREFLLLLPPYRSANLALHALRLFTVPA